MDGVVVEIEAGQPAGRLAELRQAVNKLSLAAPRRRGKAEPLLPHSAGGTGTVAEDEEEEE